MTALILNSGVGSRMGDLVANSHKALTAISETDTILSSQIRNLLLAGVKRFVITTGPVPHLIVGEVEEKFAGQAEFIYVSNDVYKETNYIYSIFLANNLLQDDIISLHGDLVFEYSVLEELIQFGKSAMTVSSTAPIPEKDFKAVIEKGQIKKVGIEFFENVLAAQPLYYFKKSDFAVWLMKISQFIKEGQRKCYAENALNEVLDEISLYPFDVLDRLCGEIDTPEDLEIIKDRWKRI